MPIPELTKPLTEADLRAPGFLDKLHEYIQFAAEVYAGVELEPWYRAVQKVVDESPEKIDLEEALKIELGQMRYLCLMQLTEDEVPHVFTRDIVQGIKLQVAEYDPWVMIRKRLTTIPHWLRNDSKSKWLKDLHENGEVLTSNKITVAGATISGSVMNWIKDYDLAMGTLAPADALKKSDYVFKGANILRTPQEERMFVQRLVDIYEKLKDDSLSLSGMEQSPLLLDPTDDRFKRIVDGVMMDIESGLPNEEYKKKFGVVKAPTSSVVEKLVPPPPPQRVVTPAQMTEVNSAKIPKTVIRRKSPAAASPMQKPVVTSTLPTGSASPKPGALVFSDDDEKEIASIKQAQHVFFKAPVGIDFDFVTKKVMGRHKLFFPSYDLEQRFSNLLVSYMKGVRDQIEFEDVMTRPENAGGLNLTGDTTEKILLTIDEEVKNAPQAKARQKMATTFSPMSPTLSQVKKSVDQTKTQEAHISPTGEMIKAPAPATRSVTRPVRKQISVPLPEDNMPRVPASSVRAPLDSRRPIMSDIKLPPKVMGPVDELANVTLQEFRHLGSTPQAAAEQIKAKIDLLETESITKRVAGVHAWQSSPINQLYLSIGQEALNSTQPVEAVIQQRQMTQPTLTKLEFDTIGDLNRRLRY